MQRVKLPVATEESIVEATYVQAGAVRTAQVGRGGFRMNQVSAIVQEPTGIAIYFEQKGLSGVGRFPYKNVRTIRLGSGELVINTPG